MVILAVVTGASIALVQANRAAAQAERARLATAFVTEVFRVSAAPRTNGAQDASTEVQSVLDQGAKLILTRFSGQPDMQAELFGTVSRIYADLGATQTAIDYAKRQLQLLDELPKDQERRARALMVLAEVSQREGSSSDAEAYAMQALGLIPDETHLRSDALVLLTRAQRANGHKAAAAESLADAERLIKILGNQPTTAKAWVLWLKRSDLDDFAALMATSRQAIQMAVNVEGPLSATAIDMRISLGRWLIGINHISEGSKMIYSATSVLQIAGGPNALRAAVINAQTVARLFVVRALPYSEAVSAIESSRAVLKTSPAPIPPIVLQKLDYELAAVRVDGGDLLDGLSDLRRMASPLLAAA
jgi:tetratricopeptide (TPR) repeat protein